jgi:hypothetical protein
MRQPYEIQHDFDRIVASMHDNEGNSILTQEQHTECVCQLLGLIVELKEFHEMFPPDSRDEDL